MSESLTESSSLNDPLQSLIADFLDAEGRGQPMDREAWLAQHASHADALKDFLANHDRMKRSAPIASGDLTLPPISFTQTDVTLPPYHDAAARSRAPAIGDRMRYFGDYELLEEIARGGMGVVYRARQINLNRIVALKMILAGQLASEQDVQRFRTEAESAANLDHPRIVPIYEVGQHAGQHYFSMGFVNGQSLAQKIVDGPMAPREAAEVLVKICEGIAYAHERGVIHRDLKPANILLDRNEEPKVTDFGLAKKLGSDSNLTGTGQILGTPSYMAPEQASGKIDEVGPLADIYSMGAILYCLLTGRPPFQAANPMDTLLQVLDKEPIPPKQLNATIPVDLETICLKCLNKEPQRRYSDANSLSKELERFLRGVPILARPVGKVEQAWRWCRRNPVVASLLAATIILTVAAITALAGMLYQAKLRGEVTQRSLLAARAATEREAEALEQANRILARSNFFLSIARWEENRVAEAIDLLEKVPPKFRFFEWRITRRQFEGSYLTCKGHTGLILNTCFSTDGSQILSASADGTFKRLDAKTGKELDTLSLPELRKPSDHARSQLHFGVGRAKGSIRCVRFSSDCSRIVTGDKDGTIRIRNSDSGEELFALQAHRMDISCVNFSLDGTKIVSTDGESIKVWKTLTGELIQNITYDGYYLDSVRFNADGTRILSANVDDYDRFYSGDMGGNRIEVWSVDTGKLIHSLTGHMGGIHDVSTSPDGTRFVSLSSDGTIRLWDANTGDQLQTFKVYAGVCVSFSPDGMWIVTGGDDNIIRIWDAESGQELSKLKGHTLPISSLNFSPDGTRLVSGSADNTIKIWDLAAIDPVVCSIDACRGSQGYLESLSISRDDKIIASKSRNDSVKIWDGATGKELHTHSMVGRIMRLSPDGKQIASFRVRGKMDFLDAETGEKLFDLNVSVFPRSLCFSSDGTRLVLGGSDWDDTPSGTRVNNLELWDLTTRKLIQSVKGHQGNINSVSVSSDGKQIVSASDDGTVRLWDAITCDELNILKGHEQAVNAAYFSPDCKQIVSASRDETVRLWDVSTGRELKSLKGHKGSVQDAKFSIDSTSSPLKKSEFALFCADYFW